MTETTSTVINTRPQYVQDLDAALLGRIFGTPDESGVLQGGLIDREDLFTIPDYVQAGADPLQAAVTATLGDPTQRQAFMDRYLPYFQDATGKPRYIPEAAAGIGAGEDTIAKALTDYFPDAKTYLEGGRGGTGVKGIYDTALSGVRGDIQKGTDTFDARNRAASLFGDAKSTIQGGLGAVDTGGQFGAQEAFERGTGRAFELAEQGLGGFDPSSVQEFMDPYKEQVIDAALKKITREGAKQRQSDAARAVGAGAFGGARSGIQAAETQRAIEETKQQTVANLMSQGYDKAMANAVATDEAERKRALQASGLTGELGSKGSALEQQAFESAAKRGLAGAQDEMRRQLMGGQELGRLGTTQLGAESSAFESGENRMLKAADMYRSMGLSSAEAQAKAAEDEKKRSLEAGRLTGGLGQTYGQLGGAQADVGQAYGKLAGTSADIGRVYAGMQPADLGFMYELGGKERQYDQQAEDFKRQNVLIDTQQALAPYSYGQTFLTQSPSASMYSQYTQGPQTSADPFLQGVGAYATMQGFSG